MPDGTGRIVIFCCIGLRHERWVRKHCRRITGDPRPLRMNLYPGGRTYPERPHGGIRLHLFRGAGTEQCYCQDWFKLEKACGFTVIQARHIHLYLEKLPVEKMWGIGPQTSAYLNKNKVFTGKTYGADIQPAEESHFD